MSIEIIKYLAHAGLGVIFPAKTFIIHEENQITIISPSDLTEKKCNEIEQNYKRILFIAPNNFHNLYLSKMKKRFPAAEFYGPKRSSKKSNVDLKDTEQFKSSELQTFYIKGHSTLSETCFYHASSKTLLVTDLFFNMHHKMNIASKIAFILVGVYHKLASSRAVKLGIDDKPEFIKSINMLGELDIEKVIPSHGDTITKQEFQVWIQSYN